MFRLERIWNFVEFIRAVSATDHAT